MIEFHCDLEIQAFDQLQKYVREGMKVVETPLIRVWVAQDHTEAYSRLTFRTSRVWICAEVFNAPRPLHGPWPRSRFEVRHRDAAMIAQGPDVISEPVEIYYNSGFMKSGVARAGDLIIEHLLSDFR